MKRVTGIGGIFFNLKILTNSVSGTRLTWEFAIPDGTGAVFEWREVDDPLRKVLRERGCKDA